MSKLRYLSVLIAQRLTLAAQEIFKDVEETILEFQEENKLAKIENAKLKLKLRQAGINSCDESREAVTPAERPAEVRSSGEQRQEVDSEDGPSVASVKQELDALAEVDPGSVDSGQRGSSPEPVAMQIKIEANFTECTSLEKLSDHCPQSDVQTATRATVNIANGVAPSGLEQQEVFPCVERAWSVRESSILEPELQDSAASQHSFQTQERDDEDDDDEREDVMEVDHTDTIDEAKLHKPKMPQIRGRPRKHPLTSTPKPAQMDLRCETSRRLLRSGNERTAVITRGLRGRHKKPPQTSTNKAVKVNSSKTGRPFTMHSEGNLENEENPVDQKSNPVGKPRKKPQIATVTPAELDLNDKDSVSEEPPSRTSGRLSKHNQTSKIQPAEMETQAEADLHDKDSVSKETAGVDLDEKSVSEEATIFAHPKILTRLSRTSRKRKKRSQTSTIQPAEMDNQDGTSRDETAFSAAAERLRRRPIKRRRASDSKSSIDEEDCSSDEESSCSFAAVLADMHQDDVAEAVRGDKVVLKLGQLLFDKGHSNVRICQRVRELGRLLLNGRHITPLYKIEDYVMLSNWDHLAAAVKDVAGYCESTCTFAIPRYALNLRRSLHTLAAIVKCDAETSGDKEMAENVQTFQEHLLIKWHQQFKEPKKSSCSGPSMIAGEQVSKKSTEAHSDSSEEFVPKFQRTKHIQMKDGIPPTTDELFDPGEEWKEESCEESCPDSRDDYVPGSAEDGSESSAKLSQRIRKSPPASTVNSVQAKTTDLKSNTTFFDPPKMSSSRHSAAKTGSKGKRKRQVLVSAVSKKSDGSRVYDKRQYCLFCMKPYLKISKHLERKHSDEVEVARAIACPKNSKERRSQLEHLRNRGNFAHNVSVLRTGEGNLVACKRPTEKMQGKEFTHCEFCQGLYTRKVLWRHVKICRLKPDDLSPRPGKNRVLSLCPSSMPSDISSNLQALLSKMAPDKVSLEVRGDRYILELGQHLHNGLSGNSTKDEYIRQKMRELGRLVLSARKMTDLKTIKELITPANFMQTVKSVKDAAGYIQETGSYKSPSLAIKVGHSLAKISEIVESKALVEGDFESAKAARQFRKLYVAKWNDLIFLQPKKL